MKIDELDQNIRQDIDTHSYADMGAAKIKSKKGNKKICLQTYI
jgi:hypothetical protein